MNSENPSDKLSSSFKQASVFLIVIFILTISVFSQSLYEKLGDKRFNRFDFINAIKYYGEAIRKDSSNIRLRQKIADSYRYINDWNQAEKWYQYLVQNNPQRPKDMFYYAEALRVKQQYDDALTYYEAYQRANPKDTEVVRKIVGLQQIGYLKRNKSVFNLENLKANSPFSDFGVSFYTSGKILFCSNRERNIYGVKITDNWTSSSFLDIYVAPADSLNKNQKVEKFATSSLNKKYHDGPVFFLPRFSEIYFTRSNSRPSSAIRDKNKTVFLSLYKAKVDTLNETVSNIEEAVHFNSTDYSVAHASLDRDAGMLFFSSDMPGGYGGSDIYVCYKNENGGWSSPINLGSEINTSGDELFPFWSHDSVLYFASNGHHGLGGLDVLSSRRVGNKWLNPKNLGIPLNSSHDDFGFIIDDKNKYGFFVSDRPGGLGSDDIYRFTVAELKVNLLAKNAVSLVPLSNATFEIYENDSLISKLTADNSGKAVFSSPIQKNYTLITSLPGYKSDTTVFYAYTTDITVDVPLLKEEGINVAVRVVDVKTKEPIEKASVAVSAGDNEKTELKTFAGGSTYIQAKPNTSYTLTAGKILDADSNVRYLNVSESVTTDTSEGL
ncbi:MAG: hypothetical protein NZ522_01955, partial [Chitinophagales bacterium]|nr:hypothetical protein [Chitinophagales bacterium]